MALILHYHPLSSFCWKTLIALYERGLPFETRLVNFGDAQARAAFTDLWPTSKIPLLEDAGRVIPETSIMIEYLEQQHPGPVSLLPGDAQAQLDVRLWDRLFDLYVMDPMQRFIGQLLRPEAERDASALAASQAGLAMAYDLIERRLGPGPWAAGEHFSLADCAAAPALFYAAIVRPLPPDHGRLRAYFERLMARPTVQRVIVEARPYFAYFPLHQAIPAEFLGEPPPA
nr:glutathione S-transferase family protein [uncultured Roseateles sp.]